MLFAPRPNILKPSVHICKYDAEHTCTFKLLNTHEKGLTLDNSVEILKQNALQEGEELEPKPKQRTMMVSNLTEGMDLQPAAYRLHPAHQLV